MKRPDLPVACGGRPLAERGRQGKAASTPWPGRRAGDATRSNCYQIYPTPFSLLQARLSKVARIDGISGVYVYKPLTFGLAFGLAMFASIGPRAQTADLRWEVLADDEKQIIDRVAADFYEESLRQSQAEAIESHTSEIYASGSDEQRDEFRNERRSEWQAMTPVERASLREAKRPLFRNLTEEQKAPFRRHALDRLGGVGALDADAIADALKNDI